MNPLYAPILVLILLAFVVVGIRYFLQYYNTKVLLHLSLELETPEVTRGENIRFRLKILPSDEVTANNIVTKFQCVKEEETGKNWDDPIMSDVAEEYEGKFEDLYSNFSPQSFPLLFRKGETREFEGLFPVPADALHTKRDGSLHVRWYLVGEVHFPPPSPPARVRQEVMVVQDVAVVHHSSATTQNTTGDASALFSGKSQDPPTSLTDSGSFGHLELGRPTESKAEPPESL